MAGGLFLFFLVGLVIAVFVGAVILRAAISLYNKLSGGPASPTAVPEPDMGKAMGIVVVVSLVNSLVSFIMGALLGSGGGMNDLGRNLDFRIQLISVPVSLAVMASMLALMLPTTFLRGLLVSLCELVIVALIVGGILLIAFLAFGVAGH